MSIIEIITCFSKIDTNTSTSCEVYPLPHMYIVKDLVPDLNNFYNQYRSIQPWLQRKGTKETGKQQYLQSVEDRKKLVSVFDILPSLLNLTFCYFNYNHINLKTK